MTAEDSAAIQAAFAAKSSPPLPDRAPYYPVKAGNFISIEHPFLVRDNSRAIESLGGPRSISKVRTILAILIAKFANTYSRFSDSLWGLFGNTRDSSIFTSGSARFKFSHFRKYRERQYPLPDKGSEDDWTEEKARQPRAV